MLLAFLWMLKKSKPSFFIERSFFISGKGFRVLRHSLLFCSKGYSFTYGAKVPSEYLEHYLDFFLCIFSSLTCLNKSISTWLFKTCSPPPHPTLNTQHVVWGMKFKFFFGKKLSNVRVKQVVWCVQTQPLQTPLKKAPNKQRGKWRNNEKGREWGPKSEPVVQNPKWVTMGGVGTSHVPNPH